VVAGAWKTGERRDVQLLINRVGDTTLSGRSYPSLLTKQIETMSIGIRWIRALPLVAAGTVSPFVLGAQVRPSDTVKPLPIEAAAGEKSFRPYSEIYVSPDGKYVAYTMRDHRRVDIGLPMNVTTSLSKSGVQLVSSYACDIYVTELATGQTRVVSGGKASNWAPSWSARGNRLAFVSDRDGVARIWIWDAESDKLTRASAAAVMVMYEHLRWVNDDTEIFAEMLPAGMTFEDEIGLIGRGLHKNQTYHPKSTVTVYTHLKESGGLGPETKRLEGYQGHSSPAKVSLGLVNVGTGKVRIIDKDFTGMVQEVDPNGRYLLVTHTVGVDPNDFNMPLTTISAIDLRSGKTVHSVEKILSGYNPKYVWAPTGGRFGYFVREPKGDKSQLALFLADVPNGKTTRVATLGESEQFNAEAIAWLPNGQGMIVNGGYRAWVVEILKGSAREIKLPVSNTGGGFSRGFNLLTTRRNGAIWQPYGAVDRFYAQAWDSAVVHQQIVEISISSGKVQKVQGGGLKFAGILGGVKFDASSDGATAAFVAGSAEHPPEVWSATSSFRTIRKLTRLYPELDGIKLGKHQLVEWTGTDGKRYKGTLMLPADFTRGKRYPTVVWQRAGIGGAQLFDNYGGLGDLTEDWHVMTTRGYAVFLPEFNNRKASDVPILLKESLLPALDTLVAMGISDRKRFGITGESLGGGVTMSIIALTDRFAAAVNTVGPCNEVTTATMLTLSGNAFRIQEGLSYVGGTPWDNLQGYLDASPFYQLHKIHTPLLMAVSRGDWTDTVLQYFTDDCYVGLRHLNQADVQYAVYSGGHGPFAFSYADRIDWWTRVVGWFDKYLKS
jgi:dipeptidyl aminopeptidase/acylaminoacyl peptidase